jgi:diguanylate cyclase (GGDEF)-like protein
LKKTEETAARLKRDMTGHKILLVEDERLQALTIKEYLEHAGYEVAWVQNGLSAIKSATSMPFELVILDVVLPDLNGNEVCRLLKNTKETQDIPIIILSAKGETKEKVSGLEAGADDYLPKPYDPSELKARVYACLRTKVLRDQLREKNRQLEEVLAKMETLAMTDQLTGLFNRRYFSSALEKEFGRAVRYNHPSSCLMIDIDHFKSINDEYGHDAGDRTLKDVAQVLRTCLRQTDTLARWGGEEFIVLLPETPQANALQVASRILRSVSTCEYSSCPGRITVSIGLAGMPAASIDTPDKLVAAADRSLYEAKAKGRNRVEVSPELSG